ncbi:hypothetical protein GGF42_006073, partial [Coemansia sp. RSA 2424]
PRSTPSASRALTSRCIRAPTAASTRGLSLSITTTSPYKPATARTRFSFSAQILWAMSYSAPQLTKWSRQL